MNRLPEFIEQLKRAPTDPFAEKVVRTVLEEVVKDCPMGYLLKLGQCLADLRKQELREQAELN